jgi:hypothetical protein
MTEVSLEAMLRRAARGAEKMFNKFGEVEMHWLVDTLEEGQIAIMTPLAGPGGSVNVVKHEIAATMRELFRKKNATRYVLVCESWGYKAATKDTSFEEMQADIEAAGGTLENMPGRFELILLQASDGHQFIQAQREIIRPAGGRPPYLGALDIMAGAVQFEGRFANMLPTETATAH